MSDQNPTPPGDTPEDQPAASVPAPPPDASTPPPPPAASVPSPADGPWSVGSAFSYGWAKFQQNLGGILVAMLILFVIGAVISAIWFFIVGAITGALTSDVQLSINPETGAITTSGGSPNFLISLFLGALGALVYYTVFGFIQAAVTRAALAITEGRPVDTSTVLSTEKVGKVIVAALLVGVATAIGYLFCFVGAVVVSFFLAYTFFFVIDQDQEPVEAMKSSFAFVKEHLGDLVVFYLASIAAYIVGSLLCGIGLIVAVPVVIIATAYTYKKFTNQAVAA